MIVDTRRRRRKEKKRTPYCLLVLNPKDSLISQPWNPSTMMARPIPQSQMLSYWVQMLQGAQNLQDFRTSQVQAASLTTQTILTLGANPSQHAPNSLRHFLQRAIHWFAGVFAS